MPNPAGALRSPAAANQYNLALVTYFEAIALSNAGLIESFDDKQLPGVADVDPKFLTKDKAGRHVGLPVYFTYYGIAYNTDLAKAEDFASWQGLADPKWKGKICIRSGQHDYNLALISAAIAHWGEAKTEEWLKGVKANLARKPADAVVPVAQGQVLELDYPVETSNYHYEMELVLVEGELAGLASTRCGSQPAAAAACRSRSVSATIGTCFRSMP